MRASHFTSRLLNCFATIVDSFFLVDLFCDELRFTGHLGAAGRERCHCDDTPSTTTWTWTCCNSLISLHAEMLVGCFNRKLCCAVHYTITLNSPPRSAPFWASLELALPDVLYGSMNIGLVGWGKNSIRNLIVKSRPIGSTPQTHTFLLQFLLVGSIDCYC